MLLLKGVYNYTKVGYAKTRAPEALFRLVKDFWELNKHEQYEEDWDAWYVPCNTCDCLFSVVHDNSISKNNFCYYTSNTFVNHWLSPPYCTLLNNVSLVGGGPMLLDAVSGATQDILSKWAGQELAMTSVYGIRIYKEGALLASHVDRLPLVISAIINVDQDGRSQGSYKVDGCCGIWLRKVRFMFNTLLTFGFLVMISG